MLSATAGRAPGVRRTLAAAIPPLVKAIDSQPSFFFAFLKKRMPRSGMISDLMKIAR
jgi:hypothetical protein